jgi:hypothetical protein
MLPVKQQSRFFVGLCQRFLVKRSLEISSKLVQSIIWRFTTFFRNSHFCGPSRIR